MHDAFSFAWAFWVILKVAPETALLLIAVLVVRRTRPKPGKVMAVGANRWPPV